jgi:hypothetical protein
MNNYPIYMVYEGISIRLLTIIKYAGVILIEFGGLKMSKKDKKKMKEEEFNYEDEECDCGYEPCSCSCHGHHHGGCDCGEDEGFERQFYTREEKIEMLEEYLTDLKAEQKGVEEALEELRKVK